MGRRKEGLQDGWKRVEEGRRGRGGGDKWRVVEDEGGAGGGRCGDGMEER